MREHNRHKPVNTVRKEYGKEDNIGSTQAGRKKNRLMKQANECEKITGLIGFWIHLI